MLVSLTIRDVVLIDRLDLRFHSGLCVLTGETGAGKSILLDSLGLALGARAESGLVRRTGSDREQAVVIAEFDLPQDHSAFTLMDRNELEPPEPGEPLVLRRSLAADGRSRAFVNDQPVGVGLLREIGETLVEIEGQFASQGLLNPANHGVALDSFAGLSGDRKKVGEAYRAWRDATGALTEAEETAKRAREDEEYLRHVTSELAALDAQPGEEAALAEERALLQHGETLAEAITGALGALADADGAEGRLADARRLLTRHTDKAAGRLDDVVDRLDRVADELAEAVAQTERAANDLAANPGRLEAAEERLFALRAAARKHRTDVESLPTVLSEHRSRLAALEDAGDRLTLLTAQVESCRAHYVSSAEALSTKRARATKRLSTAVTEELGPLRLDKAVFHTDLAKLDEAEWGPSGTDRVTFEISTNPGTAPGPINRIASGGELARIMLALKVVLSEANPVSTLVFDEVDAGIGGATAAAVGERLNRLGEKMQVLVVTHSPQVAARGAHHLRVLKGESKADRGSQSVTRVDELTDPDRREEIARMIAGARVTDEARAAAAKLMTGPSR